MTTYTFDTDVGVVPTTSTFELVTNTKVFQSPLTNSIQTVSRKGAFWKLTLQFNNLQGDDRAKMQAFLAKLNGQTHRFYMKDHGYVRRGNASSVADTLKVNGANQTGSSLVADGVGTGTGTSTQTGYLKAGDRIAFNNEYHMVTADCDASSGAITIPIAPPIRKPTNDNDDIDYLGNIYGVFILMSSASWDTRPGLISNFKIEAVEDVLA